MRDWHSPPLNVFMAPSISLRYINSYCISFPDEDQCQDPTISDKKSSLFKLATSPSFIISVVLFSLTILLAITHIIRTYKKTQEFHTAVRQTLDKDSPTSDSEKAEPPPYKTVLRLGRSYQYCDV